MKKNHFRSLAVLMILGLAAVPSFAQVGMFDQQADWAQRGSFKAAGSAVLEGDSYILTGNGDDIWDSADEGFYIYTEKSGSWSISGQVNWIEPGSNDWSKIGVMIREKGDLPESKHFWALLRGANFGDRADAAWRGTEGSGSSSSQMYEPLLPGDPPDATPFPVEATGEGLYLRVTRIADLNMFFAEWSYDGSAWNLWYSTTIEMADTVAYGLAITNHVDDEELVDAEVNDVKLAAPPTLPITANRSVSAGGIMAGDSVDVTISVLNPNEGASTVSVSETVPDGWAISNVSNGGSASGSTVSWSASAAHGQTDLGYTITVPADVSEGATLSGTIGSLAISGTGALTVVLTAPEGDQIFDLHADIYDDPDNVGVDADGNPILGMATYDAAANTYEIMGGGNDIWGNQDNFHFLYTEVSGDFVMECKVEHDESERSTSTDGWIKGMMMARQNLTPGSVNFGTRMRRDGQFSWQRRPSQDASSQSDGSNRVTFSTEGWEPFEFPLQRLVREGDQWSIYYFDDIGSQDWVKVQDTQTLVMEDPVLVGLAVTAHQVGSVQYTWFREVSLELMEPQAPPVHEPEPLGIFDDHVDIDNGNLGAAGSATYDTASDTYTIDGSGDDVWNEADAFHYVYKEWSGDFSLTADVTIDGGDPGQDWIKSMIMARQDLTPGSANITTRVRRDGQFSTQWRPVADAGGASTPGDFRVTGLNPARQRFVRSGDMFSTYYQDTDGSWVQVHEATELVLADPILIGFGVTAHDTGQIATGTFSNVELSAGTPVLNWELFE